MLWKISGGATAYLGRGTAGQAGYGTVAQAGGGAASQGLVVAPLARDWSWLKQSSSEPPVLILVAVLSPDDESCGRSV